MSEQYVYRYNDINRSDDGHAQVELLRRVIIKETEHYVWSVPHPGTWSDDKRQSSMITDQDFRKYNGKLVGRNVKMRPTL
ncbi:hypothetical protein ACAH42_004473 [Salmonella enterica]